MVRATIGPNFPKAAIRDLMSICSEIVPAALNSKMGQLSPGCIEFIPQNVEYGIKTDIVLDIEAYDYEDRAENIEDRANNIWVALRSLMPTSTFTVWLVLAKAAFASDVGDENIVCDMSMEAAIARAKHIIATSV